MFGTRLRYDKNIFLKKEKCFACDGMGYYIVMPVPSKDRCPHCRGSLSNQMVGSECDHRFYPDACCEKAFK